MFDFLKKKISSFTEKIKNSIEKKGEAEESEKPEELKEEIIEEKKEELEEKTRLEPKEKEVLEQELTEEELEIMRELREKDERELRELVARQKEKLAEKDREEREKALKEIEKEKEKIIEEKALEEVGEEKFEEKLVEYELKERKPEARLGIKSKLRKFFAGEVVIEEADIKNFLSELELALLESDVEQDTAKEIAGQMRKELVGKKIKGREDVNEFLKKEIRGILERVMKTEQINFFFLAEKKKPFVILFLGPNGAGKTTSIAKIAHKMQKEGKSAVLAAADTFRAASIEQLEKHAGRLGMRVVKHKYGADPAAVAFDAVKAAEAAKIDLVLIDSAGRQDTNVNLMNELKKINRVIKPDLKIFVGEAMAGNALLEQATQFNEWIEIDGFILTKIDCDAKGGTSISLLHKLKKPILFVGTGQGYDDLIEFTPDYIIDRVIV
ncbi:MAG: signal recognition particle-docking protein FtsY [Candidatus Diapherotrites archaeon]